MNECLDMSDQLCRLFAVRAMAAMGQFKPFGLCCMPAHTLDLRQRTVFVGVAFTSNGETQMPLIWSNSSLRPEQV